MGRKRNNSVSGTWSTRSNFSKPVNMPDIAGFVKAEIYELEISVPALARRLNIGAPRAYRMLARTDWRVSEIMNVSYVISTNIFEWYAQQTGMSETAQVADIVAAQTVATELQNLKHRNSLLENENRLLREMVDLLKNK